jgi:hypothetical protein
MGWTKTVLRHLRAFGRTRGFECEIEAELLFHIEMRTQDNIDAGMLPETAKQNALKQFGNFDDLKQRCSATRQQSPAVRINRAIKLLSLALAATGLKLAFTSDIDMVRHSGKVLFVIAILLRIFFYVRNRSRENQHPPAAQQEKILFDD